jgi:hypothetical protein
MGRHVLPLQGMPERLACGPERAGLGQHCPWPRYEATRNAHPRMQTYRVRHGPV